MNNEGKQPAPGPQGCNPAEAIHLLNPFDRVEGNGTMFVRVPGGWVVTPVVRIVEEKRYLFGLIKRRRVTHMPAGTAFVPLTGEEAKLRVL